MGLEEEGFEVALPEIGRHSKADSLLMLLEQIGKLRTGFGGELEGDMKKLADMRIKVGARLLMDDRTGNSI